jgi:hypothetical protein
MFRKERGLVGLEGEGGALGTGLVVEVEMGVDDGDIVSGSGGEGRGGGRGGKKGAAGDVEWSHGNERR